MLPYKPLIVFIVTSILLIVYENAPKTSSDRKTDIGFVYEKNEEARKNYVNKMKEILVNGR